MNRAFLIILAPALLVAATFIAFGWGYRVSLRAGVIVLTVAAAAHFLRRVWQKKPA